MIPLFLSLDGFLSYRQRVEIDFTPFDLACISGHNGAGKSSILDAITWALFGQARKRDDSLVNLNASSAEVVYIFSYENNVYRVQRTLPKGKTTQLEFNILQGDWDGNRKKPGAWKTLNESTLRATQLRIEKTLRLDYDTFVNASFFLQGKADQFTQQRAGDRKRILGSILGLEIWETYRQRAVEQRKGVETEIAALDGRLQEINQELGEEIDRKERLKELQKELERLAKSRRAQEKALESIRKVAAELAERRKLIQTLERQADAAQRRLEELRQRLAGRQEERQVYLEAQNRASEIEAAYKAWQQARADIEYWDEIAERFRQQEKQRQAPLDEINAARARLQQELESLRAQKSGLDEQRAALGEIHAAQDTAMQALELAESKLAQREQLEQELNSALQSQADAKAENPRLKAEMDQLKERIDQLQEVEGAVCPLCGQPLDEPDRQALITQLNQQGTEMGDRYRGNQTLLRQAGEVVTSLEAQVRTLGIAQGERLKHSESLARLNVRLEQIEGQAAAWEKEGSPRWNEVTLLLEQDSFCPQARQLLAQIDAELKTIGYDVAAHDAARQAEVAHRQADNELRKLERAQAALVPLEREIAELETQVTQAQDEAAKQQEEYTSATAALAAAEAQAPDLQAAEQELLQAQEQENRLRLEVGVARQKVDVLGDLKTRRKLYEGERESLARRVSQYKLLEKAFGKDGVPALLIEQALPQIELKANEVLDRLSGGSMSVRFVTQEAYKDRRREDMKETLEIQISDGAGTRDYEMFSGGEAFRVNFAIRLALSEVLAQRAGARLQTLVIDEGFGSQDAEGRQRLIEAINLVRQDFAKILVITHIDELKDAFPTRIEVEKTDRGSVIRIL